jgi:hypothetical protein
MNGKKGTIVSSGNERRSQPDSNLVCAKAAHSFLRCYSRIKESPGCKLGRNFSNYCGHTDTIVYTQSNGNTAPISIRLIGSETSCWLFLATIKDDASDCQARA